MTNKNMNIVLPTVQLQGRLTPFHVLRTSEVKVDPSECFQIKDRVQTADGWKTVVLWGLGKPALHKIAQGAGIAFDPVSSGPVGQPTRDYLMYRSVADMKLPDGTMTRTVATVEWDAQEEVEPIAEELALLEAELAKNPGNKTMQGRVAGKRKSLADARKYRVPMAETKAMNRAIRALLGLKSKYTEAELANPFVIPRVEYVPDIENPHVRQMLAARADVSANALFGATGAAAPALVEASDDDPVGEVTSDACTSVEEIDIHDEPFFTGEPEEDAGEPEVVEDEAMDPGLTPEGLDPGDYVVMDERSKWKDHTLHEVEKESEGYCKFIVGRKRGSDQLQQACYEYLQMYKPEDLPEQEV